MPHSSPASAAAYWTKQLEKPVSYCEKSAIFLVLSAQGVYAEVLAGDKKGWVIVKDWLELKEVVSNV